MMIVSENAHQATGCWQLATGHHDYWRLPSPGPLARKHEEHRQQDDEQTDGLIVGPTRNFVTDCHIQRLRGTATGAFVVPGVDLKFVDGAWQICITLHGDNASHCIDVEKRSIGT